MADRMIRESIVTTRRQDGGVHIAPMGIRTLENKLIIAPFKPSSTLNNLLREGCAAVNYTDDVRIFAGCLTGRRDWPICPTDSIDGMRLRDCLAHTEVVVDRIDDNELRPRFHCRVVREINHAPFHGFNRAQAAVIEAAILVSRLNMLATEKVEQEINYLTIAIEKTAGAREQEAWDWLMLEIAAFRKNNGNN